MDNMIQFSTTMEELHKNVYRLRSKAMKHFGLGISDLTCLMMLKKNPEGLTSTELSRECRIDKALISRTVRKLTEMGVIAYAHPRLPETTEKDSEQSNIIRRGAYRVRLKLTEAGVKMSDDLFKVAGNAASYSMQGMDDAEIAAFMCTLEKINEKFKEYMAGLEEQKFAGMAD
ncbi:MAG: MarR family transcriptional regulator [Clostridia bacterium]|nr:MarR family transcriptional regulator [Clostridia bacterium]